jgi:hypothetical protein
VLFFFPGSEPLQHVAGKPFTILQPVLAYENAHWFVQSWNCCAQGFAHFGSAVPVQPGDAIIGTNTGSNCNAGTGICENWEITTLDANSGKRSTFQTQSYDTAHRWVQSNVLEVYKVQSCDQLPGTGGITYHDFAIWDVQGHPIDVSGLSWRNSVPQQLASCGSNWGGAESGSDSHISWGGSSGDAISDDGSGGSGDVCSGGQLAKCNCPGGLDCCPTDGSCFPAGAPGQVIYTLCKNDASSVCRMPSGG